MDKETIFLTTCQAMDAICIDFRQYDPQIMLFCEVIRLISNDSIHLKRDPPKIGAWVSRQGRTNMKWMDGEELTEFMCRSVMTTPWQPRLLADVCRRVFQTRAAPAEHPATGEAGVAIETNMTGYACRQCGDCCRSLDYRRGVTAEDVVRWKESQRGDILSWVQVRRTATGDPQYRIWIDPDTGRPATPCPFLRQAAGTSQWRCDIQAVKPGVCRHYPVSRKHALMTGCRGFERPSPATKTPCTRRHG